MAPVVGFSPPSSRLIHLIVTVSAHAILNFFRGPQRRVLYRREDPDFEDGCRNKCIAFATLIPVLVLLSGLFAGLTLGYMSLDPTQLQVLSVSGTPEQKRYAKAILPIRKNGHLLLITLLMVNMLVNEALPVIADPVLGGGVQSVVVSTVLIIIFSEIIPQSLFTRHGLYLGAKAAPLTRCLIYAMWIIAWPIAKLLDWILGPHHGIIYRRAELKELINMHSSLSAHGGDLKSDTVTIIGATLDLQEKVVHQAMTPISDVFMLHIDAKLDYDLLKQIVEIGHSRIPVYETVDIPDSMRVAVENCPAKGVKILGILLVKQCVLLDPKDATPIRNLQLNRVPHVPNNESLLGILDKFQDGRSHMAVVSRVSVEKAKSVKKAVKRGLTKRLRERVGMGDSCSSSESSDSEDEDKGSAKKKVKDTGDEPSKEDKSNEEKKEKAEATAPSTMQPIKQTASFQISNLEQSMPADAVLAKQDAKQFLNGLDPTIMPLGIITLEDVLEELIGEEIYDEFDLEGAHGEPIMHHSHHHHHQQQEQTSTDTAASNKHLAATRSLGFFRSRSAPPRDRDGKGVGKASTTTDIPSGSPQPAPGNMTTETKSGTVEAGSDVPPEDDMTKPKPNSEVSQPAAAPLEAILLDRKRRLVAAASTAGSVGSTRGRSGPKGKFKSKPLSIDTTTVRKAVEDDSAPPTEVVDHEALEAEYLAATAQQPKSQGSQ